MRKHFLIFEKGSVMQFNFKLEEEKHEINQNMNNEIHSIRSPRGNPTYWPLEQNKCLYLPTPLSKLSPKLIYFSERKDFLQLTNV